MKRWTDEQSSSCTYVCLKQDKMLSTHKMNLSTTLLDMILSTEEKINIYNKANNTDYASSDVCCEQPALNENAFKVTAFS